MLTKKQLEAALKKTDELIVEQNAQMYPKWLMGAMPLKQSAKDQIVYNPIAIDGKKLIEGNNSMNDKSNYYCDYETCVALKELGYPLTSKEVRYEDKAVFVPGVLLYSAQKWLREEKKLFVEITIFEYTYGYRILDTQNVYYDNEHVVRREGHLVGSYEEALSEGIKECIKLLQRGNN